MENIQQSYCSLPYVRERQFDRHVGPNRASLILRNEKKWVNGTILRYYFFDQPTTWTTNDAEKDIVRQAFDIWKNLGIGLEFKEVNSRDEAEIRIGFMRGNGAWSYIGRDVLLSRKDKRTMNFGWDLTRTGDIDTALHEIGHTLGFPHEHQNPNSGIVWNEEAVYDALAEPPNEWERDKTYHNIIRKIEPDAIQGSSWDPNSIMHYPFEGGLIIKPERYRSGLEPATGLSSRDKVWVKNFYPPLGDEDYTKLQPSISVPLSIEPGQQKNFTIEPDVTRHYNFSTFGVSDTVIVLFENIDGELHYLTADDDSGEDYNANLRVKLFKGRNYVLRIRLYYSDRAEETTVMMW
ncbi:MAG: M12 family metallopeptidase [Mastigocoleus sp. MO_167.B18]|nr:M12 family metallopeptidase [Mastigocoleus sp. MO_167.B18]